MENSTLQTWKKIERYTGLLVEKRFAQASIFFPEIFKNLKYFFFTRQDIQSWIFIRWKKF